ncbi:hypothetical protein ACFQVC_37000 [Streptomyces monticola]|uniref:Uncharacterized protein n=1 Tax=Streptomyces monticola TaxID=2666263 RepID=A0ABW2JWL3_9ACTN
MHPPHIPTGTWWIFAAIVTVLLLVVCVPVMPTRQYKIRVALIPLLGVGFLGAAAGLRNHDLDTVLRMYCTATLVFPLGLVGRGKEMRKVVEDERLYGKQSWPPRLTAQLIAAFCVMMVVWAWLSWG